MTRKELLTLDAIERLIANNRELETHIKVNYSDTAPICYGDLMDILETARAAMRVVKLVRPLALRQASHGYCNCCVPEARKVLDALAPLRGDEK